MTKSKSRKPAARRSAPRPAAHPGMGAVVHDGGVAFRVWAPHAEAVAVVGDFNDWNEAAHPLAAEGDGYWYAEVAGARVGQEYRFALRTPSGDFTRMDPYAREVTHSAGNSVIADPEFDWAGDEFVMPPWNELVVYEMHVGTFSDDSPDDPAPATLDSIAARFGHLRRLGVNALQLMPIAEFPGDRSWGYNPAHLFAVSSTYGGPKALKQFVKAAHAAGFAVILDVVYNHFGPSDLDLWRFDGWSEDEGGGIYFYQDDRRRTPWGDTRPDYGRGPVRQFIRDNALMWLEDYRLDGLRMDMTLYIRLSEPGGRVIDDGWSLIQWINREISERFPGKITIAEDLQNDAALTRETGDGGAGFGAQWDANFVHPIRASVTAASDEWRSMPQVADALAFRYNLDAFERVIYSESHDEVANGKARVPHEVDADNPEGYFAQKRSTLAAAFVFTAPGIPMLFQGQEFLEGGWFQDTVPVDWDKSREFRGIVRLYRDLIRLRLNRDGTTRGLCGQHIEVTHCNDDDKVVAFKRWDVGGAGDTVVVVANLSANVLTDYRIGFPEAGRWRLLLNSDWEGYSRDFQGTETADADAAEEAYDNQPASAALAIGAYSVLIFAQAPDGGETR